MTSTLPTLVNPRVIQGFRVEKWQKALKLNPP